MLVAYVLAISSFLLLVADTYQKYMQISLFLGCSHPTVSREAIHVALKLLMAPEIKIHASRKQPLDAFDIQA